MIGIMIILFLTDFLRRIPIMKWDDKHKITVLYPRNLKPGSSKYRREMKKINKSLFRKMWSFTSWYYELRSLYRYPHYRQSKRSVAHAIYVRYIPWRIDWTKAFVSNDWYYPYNMGFRDYYISKWVPNIKIQAPLRQINKQTISFGISLLLLTIGLPVMLGANFYIHSTGDDNTGDGSIGTPWRSMDAIQDNQGSFGGENNVYLQAGIDFTPSETPGTTTFFDTYANGTDITHVITYTVYSGAANATIQWLYGRGDYITYDSLTIDNTEVPTRRCISFSPSGDGTAGVTVNNCITRNGTTGLWVSNPGDKSNMTITNTIFEQDGGGTGAYFDSGEGGNHSTNLSFYNNTIDNPGKDGLTFHEGGSDTEDYWEGPILVHTITFSNLGVMTEELIDVVTGTYGEIYNIDTDHAYLSYGHSAGVNETTSNGRWEIHHCIFEHLTGSRVINIEGRNLYIYNCLMIGDTSRGVIVVSDGLHTTRPAPGDNTAYSNDNINFTYCVFLDDGLAGYGIFTFVHGDSAAGGYETDAVKITNCILTSTGANATSMIYCHGTQIGAYGTPDHFDCDHNCFYDPGAVASFAGFSMTDFASWQALSGGQDANGMEADPTLVDRTGGGTWPADAYIEVGSPCIEAALPITGAYHDSNGNATVGITGDYDDNPRDINTPDIGLNEEGIPPESPTVIEFKDVNLINVNIDN